MTKPAQLEAAPECKVCLDPFRDSADMLLLLGKSFEKVRQQLGWPPEYRDALRFHLFDKHVQEPTRDNYLIMIVDYRQDAERLLEREMQRNRKDQRTAMVSLGYRARQWSIEQIARMAGFNVHNQKQISGDVIAALNALANGDPDAVKRIAAARQKETPVLIEAKVEAPVKDPFEVEGENE